MTYYKYKYSYFKYTITPNFLVLPPQIVYKALLATEAKQQ